MKPSHINIKVQCRLLQSTWIRRRHHLCLGIHPLLPTIPVFGMDQNSQEDGTSQKKTRKNVGIFPKSRTPLESLSKISNICDCVCVCVTPLVSLGLSWPVFVNFVHSNCEIQLKLWNSVEIAKFSWSCEIQLKYWNLVETVKLFFAKDSSTYFTLIVSMDYLGIWRFEARAVGECAL